MEDTQEPRVTADITKNRLIIRLSSDARKKELEKVYLDIKNCLADLKPGFDVITDLTKCNFGHLSGVPIFLRIMEYLAANEAGQVVRVVGRMTIIFKQLIRLTSQFQGYKPIYVNTFVQAEERLDSARLNNLRLEIDRQPIQYMSNQETGTGYLVDLSISGCAVQDPTLPLAVDQEIAIVIPFQPDDKTFLSTPAIDATVVRVQEDLVTSQFIDLNSAQKTLLYNYLEYEARRDEIPHI